MPNYGRVRPTSDRTLPERVQAFPCSGRSDGCPVAVIDGILTKKQADRHQNTGNPIEGVDMRPLVPGDTIGIVSPASSAEQRVFSEFRDLAAEHGYAMKIFGEFDEGFGRMAADDRRRAQNLQAAFADDSVAAILCSRGGYGSGRLLDVIDPAAIRSKIFVGYSDVTSLILHLSATAGIMPFHGPMAADLTGSANQWTRERFFSMLAGERFSYSLERADFTPVKEGVARGPIVLPCSQVSRAHSFRVC